MELRVDFQRLPNSMRPGHRSHYDDARTLTGAPRDQYSIGYTLPRSLQDGKYHKIRLIARDRRLVVKRGMVLRKMMGARRRLKPTEAVWRERVDSSSTFPDKSGFSLLTMFTSTQVQVNASIGRS